jgi:hypothetical protein
MEARGAVEQADKVLYLVPDPITSRWLHRTNASSESLYRMYREAQHRLDAYERITEEILSWVRRGNNVCVALYGHPGVFALPGHNAIARARDEGFPARMLPGVSAEDCLYADIGFDPGTTGAQSYEATDFLVHQRHWDVTAHLILWQVGSVGVLAFFSDAESWDKDARPDLLQEWLLQFYPPDHAVTLYEASPYPTAAPRVDEVPLSKFLDGELSTATTMIVPPASAPQPSKIVLDQLGISATDDRFVDTGSQ